MNRVFGELIEASDEADQTAYEPIDPPPGLPDEASVVALRFAAPLRRPAATICCAPRPAALATFLAGAARGATPSGTRRPGPRARAGPGT